MSRRRFFIRAAYVIASLAVVLVVSYTLLLPWFVRRQIVAACEAAGVHGVQFDLGWITPWRTELTALRIGDGHRIASAAADYSPYTLWNKRVSGIRLSGVELAVGLRDGKLDLGPLSELLDRPSAGPQALDLPLDRIELASATLSLQLPKQLLRLPAMGWLVRQAGGRFRVDLEVRVSDQPVRIAGTIGPLSSDFDLTVASDSLDAGPLADVISAAQSKIELAAQGTLAASAEIHGSAGQCHVKAKVEPEALSVNERHAGESQTRLNLQSIAGTFSADFTLVSGAPTRGAITIAAAGCGSRSAGVTVKGIAGTIRFDDLAGLITAPDQELQIEKFTKGKMQLAQGRIVFRLDGVQSLTVAQTQWKWLGGNVSADPFRVNLSEPVLSTTVRVADIDLAQLLDEFIGDTATGQGTVSGQVPIVADGQGIQVGGGVLEAAPGGVLRIKKLEALAAALDQSGRDNSAEVKALVLEALGNFKYDVLQTRMQRENDGLVASIRLLGRGQTGGRAAVDLKPTVRHGLDDLLQMYLGPQGR